MNQTQTGDFSGFAPDDLPLSGGSRLDYSRKLATPKLAIPSRLSHPLAVCAVSNAVGQKFPPVHDSGKSDSAGVQLFFNFFTFSENQGSLAGLGSGKRRTQRALPGATKFQGGTLARAVKKMRAAPFKSTAST